MDKGQKNINMPSNRYDLKIFLSNWTMHVSATMCIPVGPIAPVAPEDGQNRRNSEQCLVSFD